MLFLLQSYRSKRANIQQRRQAAREYPIVIDDDDDLLLATWFMFMARYYVN